MNNMNLRHKFFVWSGLILAGFSLLLSLLYYQHMKSILVQEALDKSEVILQEVEAIREYVKEVLRPKMRELHRDDTFILEAMSTTHVSLSIMKRFGRRMKGYVFRRVSLNPLNPDNMANGFEEEMFDWFEENPNSRLWQGIVRRDGKAFFVSMEPDYFESGCLRCHGDYHNAPKSLIEHYGTQGGFRFQEGELGGIDSVSIPVTGALARITRDSIIVFFVIFSSAMLALFLFNLLFGRLVITRLNRVSASLLQDNGLNGESGDATLLDRGDVDELESLRLSLGTLTRYVKNARKGAGLQPDFLGPYTIGAPLAPGTLSWIYEGVDTRTEQPVSLKLGFEEVMINPLYAACFHAELKIMQSVIHENLLIPGRREGEALILEPFQGMDLEQWMSIQKETVKSLPLLLEQLCDLVATLHSGGVVLHDLRPGVFLITDDNVLKLFDMGHAFQRDIPDVILSSGLGPQGDLRYMAPELIQGRRGDPRSDIYSLGVMLHLLYTKTLPFRNKKASIKAWLNMKKEVQPPTAFHEKIPGDIENIIVKAMAWDMEERYQWVEDLWEDLQRAERRAG